MEPLNFSNLAERRQKSIFSGILSESHMTACFTCGTCSGGYPLTGMESTKDEGLDCRKAIRMAAFGMDQELIDSRFVWICTGCQRCEIGYPMGVKLIKVWGAAKAARPRERVPGVLHKGVDMVLRTGNNMGIPEDDYVTLLEELGEELAEECCPGFVTPVEKVGADYLHFQNSKEAYDVRLKPGVFPKEQAELEGKIRKLRAEGKDVAAADIDAVGKMGDDLSRKLLNTPPTEIIEIKALPNYKFQPINLFGMRGDVTNKSMPRSK